MKAINFVANKKDAMQPQFEKLLSIRTEIYANPTRRITVKELAVKSFLSVSYLQHLYKRFFGTTLVSDMILSRVEHGKQLLVSTNLTVIEIAKKLNYCDDVSFGRQFKKVTGISPKKYRVQFKTAKNITER